MSSIWLTYPLRKIVNLTNFLTLIVIFHIAKEVCIME